jgi:parvulin-like peptidyl-prolyl isomerase
MSLRSTVLIPWLGATLALLACGVRADTPVHNDVYARVGTMSITRADYEAAVAAAVRGRFYHGRAPEAEVAKLRRDVGERMIDEVVLLAEASRRGIGPDAVAVQTRLDALEARYGKQKDWAAAREEILPRMRARAEDESRLVRLEAAVRDVPVPPAEDVEDYYKRNPDKFTEPEQIRVSIVLLKVDPSSPRAAWETKKAEAATLAQALRDGADFAALARERSGDPSAAKGGDLGYLHRGMLPDDAQKALDAAAPGVIPDPVVLLEGVAIFRLDERKPARLQSFDAAAARARDLLQRERAEAAWSELIARLRRDTPAVIDESIYLPAPAAVGSAAALTSAP